MSRVKKRRRQEEFLVATETGPSRAEQLANPSSYKSRKRKALKTSKKPQSLYQKQLDAERVAKANAPKAKANQGRLAEKIKRLNKNKD